MKENKDILKSTILVTLVTFLTKLFGFIKQAVIAAVCGATSETDAFFIGSGVIISLCIILYSAISITLLSFHTDLLFKFGRKHSNDLINASLRIFLPLSIGLSVVFYVFSFQICSFLAPSYAGVQKALLSHYIQVMSVSFVLWCYYLIINVVLETEKIFMPGKMYSLFQNIFISIAAIFFYKIYGIQALLYAILFSGLVQCILVSWCARKYFKLLLFSKIARIKEVKQLINLSIPLIAGNALYEINDIVDKQISTGLGSGNVSYLTYGQTIDQIVSGVIIGSVSTVIFAHFTSWIAEGSINKVEHLLENCINYLTIIIMPVMAMCLAAGDQIIWLLYGRGNFNVNDVNMTYGVVMGYAIGFIFQAARANIVKVFYAFKDTRRPMINGAIAVITNIIMSILLSRVIGINGVAIATSFAMLIVTVLLIKDVKKYLPGLSLRKCFSECLKSSTACLLTIATILFVRNIVHLNVYFLLLIEGSACLIIYTVALVLMKSKCIFDILEKASNYIVR